MVNIPCLLIFFIVDFVCIGVAARYQTTHKRGLTAFLSWSQQITRNLSMTRRKPEDGGVRALELCRLVEYKVQEVGRPARMVSMGEKGAVGLPLTTILTELSSMSYLEANPVPVVDPQRDQFV